MLKKLLPRFFSTNVTSYSYLLHVFNETRASILFLGVQYLELRDITKYLVSSFIDSGVGLVSSTYI